MSTPKQPVINAVLITYINYSITENYIGKMAANSYVRSSQHKYVFQVSDEATCFDVFVIGHRRANHVM